MGDIDDAHAVGLEVTDHPEQDFHLGRRQGRCRLVEDQDAGILDQRLGDLNDLLLSDAQIAQGRVRIDIVMLEAL